MESIGTEGDLTVGPEAEEKVETSEVDPEIPSEIGGADQLPSYIIQFANAVKLYQKKNHIFFRCGSPDHLVKGFPKDLGKITR